MSNADILLKLEKIHNDINEIKNDVSLLQKNMQYTQNELEKVKTDTNKMGSHIDFIERVYDGIKFPLSFICSKIGNENPRKYIDKE